MHEDPYKSQPIVRKETYHEDDKGLKVIPLKLLERTVQRLIKLAEFTVFVDRLQSKKFNGRNFFIFPYLNLRT